LPVPFDRQHVIGEILAERTLVRVFRLDRRVVCETVIFDALSGAPDMNLSISTKDARISCSTNRIRPQVAMSQCCGTYLFK